MIKTKKPKEADIGALPAEEAGSTSEVDSIPAVSLDAVEDKEFLKKKRARTMALQNLASKYNVHPNVSLEAAKI